MTETHDGGAAPPTLSDCISIDPFAGDFGGSGDYDAVLSDKIVKGRKPHTCSHCNGAIAIGEQHRARKEVYDGELMSFRWCNACCLAMLDDDPLVLEGRREG